MPKVSYARRFLVGLVGPKPRAQAVGDGQLVYIPVPPSGRLSDGVTREEGRGAALELLSSKPAGAGAGKATPLRRRGAMGSPQGQPRSDSNRQENPLSEAIRRPYRKPTQVGGGKYPKVNGRPLVKELGKLTP